MNFFGHAFVAYQYSSRRLAHNGSSPLLALGAMLPDFASMSGNRIQSLRNRDLLSGVDLHHATDDLFHRAPAFGALCAESVQYLLERGLQRGSARAVSHVGIELMVDGELSGDERALQLYRDALDMAGLVSVMDSVVWLNDCSHQRWRLMVARLRGSAIPAAYTDPTFVAERLFNILAPRRRLALKDGEPAVVLQWIQTMQGPLRQQASELVDTVCEALRQVDLQGADQPGGLDEASPEQPLQAENA